MSLPLSSAGPSADKSTADLTATAILLTEAVAMLVAPEVASVAEREILARSLRHRRTWLLGWIAEIEADGRADLEGLRRILRERMQCAADIANTPVYPLGGVA